MLIGQNGTGKSTCIDAICNFVFDTTWEETTRFHLVKDAIQKYAHDRRQSKEWMTIYTINHGDSIQVPFTLNVIDTPGFGTLDAIEECAHFLEQMSTLKSLENSAFSPLNAICFVFNSSSCRQFDDQTYIIDYVQSFFTKEISDNLILLETFPNPKRYHVYETILQSRITLKGDIIECDNSLLFSSSNQSSHCKDGVSCNTHWNMGKERFIIFLKSLQSKREIYINPIIFMGHDLINQTMILLQQRIFMMAELLADSRKQILETIDELKERSDCEDKTRIKVKPPPEALAKNPYQTNVVIPNKSKFGLLRRWFAEDEADEGRLKAKQQRDDIVKQQVKKYKEAEQKYEAYKTDRNRWIRKINEQQTRFATMTQNVQSNITKFTMNYMSLHENYSPYNADYMFDLRVKSLCNCCTCKRRRIYSHKCPSCSDLRHSRCESEQWKHDFCTSDIMKYCKDTERSITYDSVVARCRDIEFELKHLGKPITPLMLEESHL